MHTPWLPGLLFAVLLALLLPSRTLRSFVLFISQQLTRLAAFSLVLLAGLWQYKMFLPPLLSQWITPVLHWLQEWIPTWLPEENRPLWVAVLVVALALPVLTILEVVRRQQEQNSLLKRLLSRLWQTAESMRQELNAQPNHPETQQQAHSAIDAIRQILRHNTKVTASAPTDQQRLSDLLK